MIDPDDIFYGGSYSGACCLPITGKLFVYQMNYDAEKHRHLDGKQLVYPNPLGLGLPIGFIEE